MKQTVGTFGNIGRSVGLAAMMLTALSGVADAQKKKKKAPQQPQMTQEEQVFWNLVNKCGDVTIDAYDASEACNMLLKYYDIDKPVGIRLSLDGKVKMLRQRSTLAVKQYDYDQAVADLEEAMKYTHPVTDLLLERGKVYLMGHEYEKAREDLQLVLLQGENMAARELLIDVYKMLQDQEGALEQLNKVLAANPTRTDLVEKRIQIHQNLKMRDALLEDYKLMQTLQPLEGEWDYKMAWELSRKQDYKGALAAINSAISLKPGEAEYYRFRANLYSWGDLKNEAKAIADMEKTLGLSGGNSSENLISLAKLYGKTGKKDKAVETLKAAYDGEKTQQHINSQLGGAYEDLGMWDEALFHVDQALKMATGTSQDYLKKQYAGLLIKKGDTAAAIAYTAKTVPDEGDQIMQRAILEVRKKTGRDKVAFLKATQELKESLPPDQVKMIGAVELAEAERLFDDDPQKAFEIYTKNLTVLPAKANEGVGRYHMLNREYAKAAAAYEEELKNKPDDRMMALFRHADASQMAGNTEAARASYDKVVEEYPSQVYSYIGRSDFYGEVGELDKALADAKKAVEMSPKMGATHNSLAWVLYLKGDYQEARKSADKALAFSPDDGNVLDTLAHIQRATGETEKAIETFRKSYKDASLFRYYQRALYKKGTYKGPEDGNYSQELTKAFEDCIQTPDCDPTR